jgi:hypothetical protein
MASRCLVLAVAACLAVAGCSWRPKAPSDLDQTIAIRVVADQGRLPRAGLDLQAAAAAAVPYRTGWQVRGDGEARLDLSIDRDEFAATANDARDIASRWRYRVHITALLVSKHGHRTWTGSGTGYAGSRAEEQLAVQTAAKDVADDLARWLAAQAF